jgi:hypothetical protein
MPWPHIGCVRTARQRWVENRDDSAQGGFVSFEAIRLRAPRSGWRGCRRGRPPDSEWRRVVRRVRDPRYLPSAAADQAATKQRGGNAGKAEPRRGNRSGNFPGANTIVPATAESRGSSGYTSRPAHRGQHVVLRHCSKWAREGTAAARTHTDARTARRREEHLSNEEELRRPCGFSFRVGQQEPI